MADYNIQTQISCGNVQDNTPRCVTSGRIFMTPTTDVLIEMSSTFNYSLSSDVMTSLARVFVAKPDLSVIYLVDFDSDSTVSAPPHSGVFNLHGSALIPAGTPLRIEYTYDIRFLSDSANISTLSTGTMHMTMTAVPEPASLGLLAFGAFLLMKRNRRA